MKGFNQWLLAEIVDSRNKLPLLFQIMGVTCHKLFRLSQGIHGHRGLLIGEVRKIAINQCCYC